MPVCACGSTNTITMTDIDAMELDGAILTSSENIESSYWPPSISISHDTEAAVTEIDALSELSDPPSELEHDVSTDDAFILTRKRRVSSTSLDATERPSDTVKGELEDETECTLLRHKRRRLVDKCHFEKLPKEVC